MYKSFKENKELLLLLFFLLMHLGRLQSVKGGTVTKLVPHAEWMRRADE
jgi:hypothetical protein